MAKARKPLPSEAGFGLLRERLDPLLGSVEVAPVEPTPAPPPLLLTETQIMKIAFEAIGDEAAALDFGRIVIIAPNADQATQLPLSSNELDPSDTATEIANDSPRPVLEPLHEKAWHGEDWCDALPVGIWLSKSPQLTNAQRALLERAIGQYLPTLGLRRLHRADALTQLRTFVSAFRARGDRHVRVVTGKGVSSVADPVIKPAVIDWCEDSRAVVGYAPEIDVDGDFGSVVLELRASGR